MTQPEFSLGAQLDRVFDGYPPGGLAQRVAWLAVEDPEGDQSNAAIMLREITDTLHARRVLRVAAPAGSRIARSDTDALVHLVAIAAFGEGDVRGVQLRRSAGIDPRTRRPPASSAPGSPR